MQWQKMSALTISTGNYTFEVDPSFVCLESTTSKPSSLEAKLTMRVGRAAITMARFAERTWDNSLLKINAKVEVYRTRFLSTLLGWCSFLLKSGA